MRRLLGALRCGDDLVAHPGREWRVSGECGLLDGGEFFITQVDAADVAAGVCALGSSGREAHDWESSGTTLDSSSLGLDRNRLTRRFKSMNTTQGSAIEAYVRSAYWLTVRILIVIALTRMSF